MLAALKRKPDEIIGEEGNPYLLRWWLFKCRFFNIYLHKFLRDDDDRALHDHPWRSLSIGFGDYLEMIADGDTKYTIRRHSLAPVYRTAEHTHRIILFRDRNRHPIPVWTLFMTGKRIREWGFHCPKGWRRWQDFCDERDSGKVGRGCD